MKLVKAAGALLLLGTLLLGVPWALLTWGSASSLIDVNWPTALLRPDDGVVLLGLLSLVGWGAWGVLAVTTVSELAATVSRGRLQFRIPGTGWLRPLVAGLLAAAAAPLAGPAMASTTPEPATAPTVAVVRAEQSSAHDHTATPVAPATERQPAPTVQYVVEPGDELWSLAERFLGSGDRWREITAANPGMSHDMHLHPGQRINLPAGALPDASPGIGDPETITVAPGDTLWDLAGEHLGDSNRWLDLQEANRDLVEDPDRIDVGWELQLPAESRSTGTAETTADDAHAPAPAPDKPSSGRPAHARAQQDAGDPSVDSPSLIGEGQVPADGSSPTAVATESETTQGLSPAPVPTGAATAAPTGGTETASAPEGTPNHSISDPADDQHQEVLGPIGAVLAAGIFAGVAARRRTQLLQRAVGRRILPVRPELQQFWSSLVRRTAQAQERIDVGPTGIVLGWAADAEVMHDLETGRCTLVQGAPDDALAAVSAILTSLMCAPWSTGVDVVAVQSPDDWERSLDDPRIAGIGELDHALVELQRVCASRRIEMGSSNLEDLRSDSDRASAWAPLVYLFTQPIPRSALERIHDCLDLGRVGVSVVAAVAEDVALVPGWELIRLESPEDAVRVPDGRHFLPQLLTAPARHAVIELFAHATATSTESAPWWDEAPLPPNVTVLPRKTIQPNEDTQMSSRSAVTDEHPTLLLLGPVALHGCSGPVPARSTAASIECCAWLLLNPGSTPSAMCKDLMIAESTRRSNVSRLRSWLGTDPTGEPYLPDGYSGRLELHPDVESDWERFQMLLSGGVNHASTPLLREALGLVRGQPLEHMSFQWPWSEQLRTDMVSMVTDAAAVLADRAMEQEDVATARWAIDKGRLAAGEDETIAVREIQLFARLGERRQLDQSIRQLTRSVRAAGRDLTEDSVRRIQQALHSVLEAQQAN
ncbi:LysM peptidoglycan-binding domain-containing protein [Tessaracoccus sp. OS52]|uniref:LysM peptidoglycan-binding domain-containing protein n=1 Tax=Tessaracoccus sp. OS52 TaxID=2886691 RepID=UPI001D116AB8|nr:LysM peptidoglycan-binding domain-containing protein [Tessaracoccus sp. OS52]MCC2593868.1 LysM peptidoglycan-binding domain-containing protein [Tessaracoccus sp. OS52]